MTTSQDSAEPTTVGSVDTDRTTRYRDIIDPEVLRLTPFFVYGVGAIGRQVALQLAAMGCEHITVYDHDTVEPHNMGVQGYCPSHLGDPKAAVTLSDMRTLNPEGSFVAEPRRAVSKDSSRSGVHMLCVDKMLARKVLASGVSTWASSNGWSDTLMVDARMSAESYRVYTVSNSDIMEQYVKAWFPDAEANAGRCTARSTMYCAASVASCVVSRAMMWLRRMSIPPLVAHDMLADMTVVSQDITE